MKKKSNSSRGINLSKSPLMKRSKKNNIETINDEYNSIYYDILNPKLSIKNDKDLELLVKEIEFYKNQFQTEKNINKSLNKEISHFNEIQRISEDKTYNIKLLEEITILEKKNKFLEESVFKLKNTLDKANILFPDFLEHLQKENNNNKNKNNKICLTEDNENQNNIEMNNLIEENNKLRNRIKDLNNEVDKLRTIQNSQKNDESILSNKLEDINFNKNRLIEDNKKLKNYIDKINDLKKNNESYLSEINYLKKIIEEKSIIIENNKKKENKDFVNNNDINYYKNENKK